MRQILTLAAVVAAAVTVVTGLAGTPEPRAALPVLELATPQSLLPATGGAHAAAPPRSLRLTRPRLAAAAPPVDCPAGSGAVTAHGPCVPLTGTPAQAVEVLEQLADALPLDWRAWGVEMVVGCHPVRDAQGRCPWATYDIRTDVMHVGPKAFASWERLEYVVAHELGHAWQVHTGWDAAGGHLAAWGWSGLDGKEAAADCIAAALGRRKAIYWDCPTDARGHMADLLGVSG